MAVSERRPERKRNGRNKQKQNLKNPKIPILERQRKIATVKSAKKIEKRSKYVYICMSANQTAWQEHQKIKKNE